MPKTTKNALQKFLKNIKKKRALLLVIVIGVAIVAVASVSWGYRENSFNLNSSIAPLLRVFYYNQSGHVGDPVADCWYDSGDYIVFIQRNTNSVYYLSLAYLHSRDEQVQKDLRVTIDQQLNCIDEMISSGWKQFRDQDSHGIITPPLIHEIQYPQRHYSFKDEEGLDVYLLRALIARNLGDDDGFRYWLERSEVLSYKTRSENCCEEGEISIEDKEVIELALLAGKENVKRSNSRAGWAASFENIRKIDEREFGNIKLVLDDVLKNWDDSAKQFDYIGGNYDIAGTITLERLYSQASGDTSFNGLSNSLYAYLHGNNAYGIDFANYEDVYHPCGKWWANCNLKETLINGIDEDMEFDPHRSDIWRLTEVQLVGQAEYVLSYVLYHGL